MKHIVHKYYYSNWHNLCNTKGRLNTILYTYNINLISNDIHKMSLSVLP